MDALLARYQATYPGTSTVERSSHGGRPTTTARAPRRLEDAGLPRVRFHDLRHAFGSTAVNAFPLSDVQAMLGHARITTTMRYAHHRPGKHDAQRLAAPFGRDSVSPFVSSTGDTEPNSEELSDTNDGVSSHPDPPVVACKALYTGSIPVVAFSGGTPDNVGRCPQLPYRCPTRLRLSRTPHRSQRL